MMNKNPFILRWTEGSGPRRIWTYMQPDGSFTPEYRTAIKFTKRAEAYAKAREVMGETWHSNRLNAIRYAVNW